jgi:nicotinamide-nucleotide amidase
LLLKPEVSFKKLKNKMMPTNEKLAAKIIKIAHKKNLKISTAESCTGGLLAALLTSISGASAVFDRGFVTYSNAAKNEMLGVKKTSLKKFGAVSKQVASEMSQGVLKNSAADVVIAITGIAGPNGGSKEKPVGLVYIAALMNNKNLARKFVFKGDRNEIRELATIAALKMLKSLIS